VCVVLHTSKCCRVHLGSRAALRRGFTARGSQAPGSSRLLQPVLGWPCSSRGRDWLWGFALPARSKAGLRREPGLAV